MAGKVVIVTGANSGIGKETSVALAAMGATVVMTARDMERGATARQEVERRSGSSHVKLSELDLANFDSIRAFAKGFLAEHDRLDVLVNNAGLIMDTRQFTNDGFEMMFGVNHLGHFLLTDLLRDRLVTSAPSRVVVVSSVAHRLAVGGMSRTDLQSESGFTAARVYALSKLANLHFTYELARQLEGTGVTVNALHPGSINSNFGQDGDTGVLAWFIRVFGRIVLRSPKSGAKTSVLLASSQDQRITEATGGYFSHGRKWPASRQARNAEAAGWLWRESEQLVEKNS